VLLLDVLEHLEEPSEFVRQCVDAFPALGHLLITVPARQGCGTATTRTTATGGYDRAGATTVCQRAGVTVISGGFFSTRCTRCWRCNGCSRCRAVEFAPVRHRWYRLVAAVLYRDGVWLPSALLGSSLLLDIRASEACMPACCRSGMALAASINVQRLSGCSRGAA
jgi:hypothetical protein